MKFSIFDCRFSINALNPEQAIKNQKSKIRN